MYVSDYVEYTNDHLDPKEESTVYVKFSKIKVPLDNVELFADELAELFDQDLERLLGKYDANIEY